MFARVQSIEGEPRIDVRSPISWNQLRALLEYRLERARARNDTVGLSLAETEAIRGEIRALRSLLDLPNEAARTIDPTHAPAY
jgi:hypothetical protein